MKPILNTIPRDLIDGFILHRLGVFKNSSLDLVELNPKKDYPPHSHKKSKAKFYIVKGQGTIILNNKKKKYSPGQMYTITKGMNHGFIPKTQTLFLSIQTPPIKNPRTGHEDIHF